MKRMRTHTGEGWGAQYRNCGVRAILLGMMLGGGLLGCRDALSTPSIPDGTQSPSTYLSKQGALALTHAETDIFREAIQGITIKGGLLTDELSNSDSAKVGYTDARSLPEGTSSLDPDADQLYRVLQQLRGQAHMARGVLTEYASDLSPAVRGQLYAFEGYAELWLADLFCSGVPLSTLDYNADFTYHPSSTTEEVYEHAIVLFDSALALVDDSADLKTLATVGKGRALLSLGRYEEAATTVAHVEVTDAYRIRVTLGGDAPVYANAFAVFATVSDHEGGNGLFYRSSGDPRTRSDTVTAPLPSGHVRMIYFPDKYAARDSTWFSVATGIEAALITAEAALHREPSGGAWLSILNALRTTGTYSGIDTTASGDVDTVWDAGSGGVARLGPLSDPGSADARINLLFAERAAWLFVTGQRQADLRRLVRVYGRNPETVYPTGPYFDGLSQIGRYGSDITEPIPADERNNPYFQGCLSRD